MVGKEKEKEKEKEKKKKKQERVLLQVKESINGGKATMVEARIVGWRKKKRRNQRR